MEGNYYPDYQGFSTILELKKALGLFDLMTRFKISSKTEFTSFQHQALQA
jgi:hypothetical protein